MASEQNNRRGYFPVSASTFLPLLPFLILAIIVFLVPAAQGLCFHQNYYYPNGSEWEPEVCVRCRCEGWVSVCRHEECGDPQCPPDHILRHHPHHCCPQCLPPPSPCHVGQNIFQPGEVWSSGRCEECRCVEGITSCTRLPCPIQSCAIGQMSLQLPDQCCPQCVPLGRSCSVDGSLYNDGEFWSPVQCSRCQCRDGQTQCHVAYCPRLTCPANHTLEIATGTCCPTCQGTPCVVDGAVYESNDEWYEDDCRKCACVAGRVHCHTTQCTVLSCPPHQQPHTAKGSCCPTCVNTQGWCVLESGVRKAPGQRWNRTRCETCVCRDGEVICNKVECSEEGDVCGPGQELVTLPGACCPQCVNNHKICIYEEVMHQSGDIWNHGDCEVCSCDNAMVTCYTASCPVCPPGTEAASPNFAGECCPRCQPLPCPESCLICLPGSPPICLACGNNQQLQNGVCVEKCAEGKFSTGRECVTCNPSCASCSQDSKYHCTKCNAPLILREGECVVDCGRGYYAEEGSCVPCHESCSECWGPRNDQCQVCPARSLLNAGVCAQSCPPGHYPREQVCETCAEACQQCGVQECLQCLPGYWLEEGHCLPQCSPGFYHAPGHTCLECHPSCQTCESAGISSCTSCPPGLILSAGSCVMECLRGNHITSEDQECKPCHPSCATCTGPGYDQCLECSEADQVINPVVNSFIGTCNSSCPSLYKLHHNTCVAPPLGCEVWHVSEPHVCQRCEVGWLEQRGTCVKACDDGYYQHKKKPMCFECDPRCLTCTGPGHRSCQSCYKGATLHTRKTGSECFTKCYRRHYLAHDNTCQACHSSCSVCTAYYNTSQTASTPLFSFNASSTLTSFSQPLSVCVRCKSGTLREGEQCVSECTPGFYHSEGKNKCVPCHSTCRTCHGPHITSCSNCFGEAALSSEGTCEKENCGNGMYLSDNNTCLSCEGDCLTCSSDSSTCLTCPSTRYLLYGKCVTQCPHMFYMENGAGGECRECHWTCEQCLGPSENDCVTCGPNMFRQGNKCLAQCSSGYYPVDYECHRCPGGCSKCDSDTSCLSCHAPYLLQEGHCVTSCHSGSFANVFDNICYDCGNHCMECSLYECQACSPPYLLKNGQCVEKCGPDHYPDSNNGTCHHNIEPPTIHLLAPLVVEYGHIAQLNSSVLHVKDPDTPNKRVIVKVVDTPSNGILFMVNKGRNERLKRGNKFMLVEMLKGKIFYEHKTGQPLYGEMRLKVSDGQLQSPSEVVSITVISNYPPEVITNEPIISIKGQSAAITSKVLKVRDLDNPESVTLRVVGGPLHGHLSIHKEELLLFTLDELENGSVTYTHDGTDSHYDMILLQASDEHNTLNLLVRLFIVPSNHNAPVLIKNQGAVVEAGKKVQISTRLLQASDFDTEDDNLVFTLLPILHNPGLGKLALIIPLPPSPDGFFNDGWTLMDDNHLVRPTTSFTQRDLRVGHVWYVHERTDHNQPTSDQLLFSVADSANPPNVLANQTFNIRVKGNGHQMMSSPDTPLGITVQAGQAVILSPSHFSFSGGRNRAGKNLLYTITHPLPAHHGSLFNIDSPGLELRQFMQSDINDMKIVYMPPFEDLGQEDQYFSFKFTVWDQTSGRSNTLPELKFTIHVTPVQGTHLTFTHPDPHLTVIKGGRVTIENDVFEVSDGAAGVHYILLEAPTHGNIIRQAPGVEPIPFTQEDTILREELELFHMEYMNDGSNSTFDSFVILALGQSSEASTRITLTIQPHPVQSSPNYTTPPPSQLHPDFDPEYSQLPVKSHNASFFITLREYDTKTVSSEHLYFTATHSVDHNLIYTLVSQPLYGSLVLTQPVDAHTTTQAPSPSPIYSSTDIHKVTDFGDLQLPIGIQTILGVTHKFSQADLVAGQVLYISDQEVGPRSVTDNIIFNVTDSQNNVLANQVLYVEVEAVDNQIPDIVLGKELLVEEGGRVVISPSALNASDLDTPSSSLFIVIDAPPVFGYLIDGSSEVRIGWMPGSPPMQFPVSAVLSGRLAYLQSRHLHQEPSKDSFLFHVTDGIQRSPSYRLNITIQESDDESPVLVGEAVVVEQGETVVVNNHSLSISDPDTEPEKLKIKIVVLPKHGTLHIKASPEATIKQSETLKRESIFTSQNVLDGLLLYSHDGSFHHQDAMEIMVSDRTHETGGIIEFTILQEEHTSPSPALQPGTGLSMNAGGAETITLGDIWKLDSVPVNPIPDTTIKRYTLTKLPISGKVEVLKSNRNSWTTLNVGDSFTHHELISKHIRFVHQKGGRIGRDELHFRLQNDESLEDTEHSLFITVNEDQVPPRLTVNNRLTLPEHSTVPLTTMHLAAFDHETHPNDLQFMVLKGPMYGQLEFTSRPGEAVTMWHQRVVVDGGLVYHHQAHNQLTAPALDYFTFIVTDRSNNISSTFHITVNPVDDAIPHLTAAHIRAQKNARKVITQFELKATDADTKDELIVFTVVQPSTHGKLQLATGDGFLDAEMFNMQDIYDGSVSYLHDGSDSTHDIFSVVVSDSTNTGFLHLAERETMAEPSADDGSLKNSTNSDENQTTGNIITATPVEVMVEIVNVESGAPVLMVNKGLSFLQQQGGKIGRYITAEDLKVEDKDTSPEELYFSITQPPVFGHLSLATNPSTSVTSFTMADIIAGYLYYELDISTHETHSDASDKFSFEVTDGSSSTVSDNVFYIMWTWLVMAYREYNVTETDGEARIVIKRAGNLKQMSLVTCLTHSGSARGRTRRTQSNDFEMVSEQIQFQEGETEKHCVVPIIDDRNYEGQEKFSVKLVDPNYAIVGKPKKSIVTIRDNEDKPFIFFETSLIEVNETEDFIFARLKRSGDASLSVSVMCTSEDGSAIGSKPNQLSNGTDFIHRLEDESSRVLFPPGVRESSCSVKIIDDPILEMDEDFRLILKDPTEGATLGLTKEALVIIQGPNDESHIGFSQLEYIVSESTDEVSVKIERFGADLKQTSSVWCATKSYFTKEAEPSFDYIHFSKQIVFSEGQKSANCSISLIDDNLNPKLEGPERFIVFISAAQNASILPKAWQVVVTITDEEDMPSIQFTLPEIKVRENDTIVKIPVQRLGDVSKVSSVQCFTRQRSAKTGLDFIERPSTDDSVIIFPKGISRMECEVGLIDDLIYEKEEKFIVKLSRPYSPSNLQPYIGENKIVRITIQDWEDRPQISLQQGAYTVAEPHPANHTSTFALPVIRLGDSSQATQVMLKTKDGTARAGEDYHRIHSAIQFAPGQTVVSVNITLLYNPRHQRHKTFMLILGPDEPNNAALGSLTTTTVTLLPHASTASSVLPAPPLVISIFHLDSVREHLGEPASPGHPLVCVTSCDLSYPDINSTSEMCASAGLNSTSIRYSWEVAFPSDGDGMLTPFHSLTDDTVFASSHNKVLDPMFFARHFRVRCVAQPVQNNGLFGIPLRSEAISISGLSGICQAPLVPGQLGGHRSQSFIATLTYVNSTDQEHPNMVKIHVEIPHQDGMVPLLSTLPIHNVHHLLTEQLYRTHHSCSNLLPEQGFLAASAQHTQSYHHNLIQNQTKELYQHLSLDKCTWTFSAWFALAQLVDMCGGQVIPHFQVSTGGQSFLTVRVPLYVSYVTATAPPGWSSRDHRTELSVSLYYNTLLWHSGLTTTPLLTAKVQVTRLSMDEAGRLVVDFRTYARFWGQFVMSHPKLDQVISRLIPPDHINLNFSLQLLWTAPTLDGPEQVWQAKSDYTLQDYTGVYTLELIPCTVTASNSSSPSSEPSTYSSTTSTAPLTCTPHSVTSFPLNVALQQTQRPVPLAYTLDTDFELITDLNHFLEDPSQQYHNKTWQIKEELRQKYGPGETIYGKVWWRTGQDLPPSYTLTIQRVYICTGTEGYVPTYDPTGEVYREGPQYGCIQPSPNLRHTFLILDRHQRVMRNLSSSESSSGGVEAYFASDVADMAAFHHHPGSDGFLFNTDALYAVNSGYQWFIQVLYTIGPTSDRIRRDISLFTTPLPLSKGDTHSYADRELNSEEVEKARVTREYFSSSPKTTANSEEDRTYPKNTADPEDLPIPEFLSTLHTRNGTNMRGFHLVNQTISASDSALPNALYIVTALAIVLAIAVVIFMLVKQRCKRSEKDKVIVVRSRKNEREEFRRKVVGGKTIERPKTLPANMTLNSESNLQTVKVKTLAITVRNNLEDEGTEV